MNYNDAPLSPDHDPNAVKGAKAFQVSRRGDQKRHPYRSRKFLAVDGEGVKGKVSVKPSDTRSRTSSTPALTSSEQAYVLLGSCSGDSFDEITARELSTDQCLGFLIDQERKYPFHIKVGFSLNYDVNMIVKDLDERRLERLLGCEWVRYHGYRCRWIKGKWFEISKGSTYTKLFDIFSFFGCSFLKACRDYLGDDPRLVEVEKGKAERDQFEYGELDTFIRPYMRQELRLMLDLVNTLRDSLETIGLIPLSWHGPGAVASTLLRDKGIDGHMWDDEPYIRDAAAHAYAGGRFELFKTGTYEETIYNYDIRSAYPYALTQCPSLDQFHRTHYDGTPTSFSLCKVRYAAPDPHTAIFGAHPIVCRDKHESLYFPPIVDTWIWGVEYLAAQDTPGLELVEWIEFYDDGTRPFAFLADLYLKRARWKAEGNPVQFACKLCMNSIYGKLAQRINWDEVNMRAPRWHQLRWAGYLTATCRAMMWKAIKQAPDRIISIETDGIYSEVPLDLPIGPALGQFERTIYDGGIFAQSGIYWTRQGADWSTGKTRGFSSNKTDIDIAVECAPTLSQMVTVQHRFRGLPAALGMEEWRHWVDQEHVISWGGGGKRKHRPEICETCSDGGQWHRTSVVLPEDHRSQPHSLPWLVGDAQI